MPEPMLPFLVKNNTRRDFASVLAMLVLASPEDTVIKGCAWSYIPR
jgi:hypothetical protein